MKKHNISSTNEITAWITAMPDNKALNLYFQNRMGLKG